MTQIGPHALRGYAMGAADVVPGVSGGTIALVLGIYEPLVGAVRDGAAVLAALLRLDPRRAWERFVGIAWGLVLPVLAGIALALLTLAAVLSRLLDSQPVLMSATVFGLIVGSIAVVAPDVERRDTTRVLAAVATALVVFVLLGLHGAPIGDPALPYVLLSGAIAICGMILPGVSGAFILLMLGMYEPALRAIHERDAVFVGVFGVGAIAGLATFGAFLKWLLERYHDTVLAVLVGLMAGSLRVLWPWPGEFVGDPRLGAPVAADLPAVVPAALGGAVAVFVLGRLGRPSGT
jgi:putative membrane protein